MMVALGLGLALGLSLQWLEGMHRASTALRETATWYGLFGRGFVALIRMLVIPLVFVSIVKVVLDHSGEEYLSKVAVRGVFWLLATTGIAALVGIALANLFGLGQGTMYQAGKAALREQTNLVNILAMRKCCGGAFGWFVLLRRKKTMQARDSAFDVRKELAEAKEQAGTIKRHWEKEKASMDKVRKVREELDAARLEMEKAERAYDLNKVAELRHGKIRNSRRN